VRILSSRSLASVAPVAFWGLAGCSGGTVVGDEPGRDPGVVAGGSTLEATTSGGGAGAPGVPASSGDGAEGSYAHEDPLLTGLDNKHRASFAACCLRELALFTTPGGRVA
jgi:hypothetical protein